jgi:hypothetical protein
MKLLFEKRKFKKSLFFAKIFIFKLFFHEKCPQLDKLHYIADSNAFLFSLTNKDDEPCKMNIDPNQSKNAIFCGPQYGPSFGYNYDICIRQDPFTGKSAFSRLGNSYIHPRYTQGSNEIQSFLAGSHYFQLSEIEVYQKE